MLFEVKCGRLITFSELETVREEEVAGYFKILPQSSPRLEALVTVLEDSVWITATKGPRSNRSLSVGANLLGKTMCHLQRNT
jgi:hypothetical protein